MDATGFLRLAGHKLKVGTPLAGRRVTAGLDGHLVHNIDGGVLAKTLPAWPPPPRPRHRRARSASNGESPATG